jgi:hypothetical protein
VKAGPSQKGRTPWRGKYPGELRARYQSKPLCRVADSHAEQHPEGDPNATRGTALETAYGCVRGTKLWRVTPRADPAWNKAGRLGADEGAKRLREPEGAGGQACRPDQFSRCSERGNAEGVENLTGGAAEWRTACPRVESLAKPRPLGSGSVLGLPLKRSRSP